MARHTRAVSQPTFRPPPFRWYFIGVLSVEFALLIWALMHQFIPSTTWKHLATCINWAVSSIIAIYTMYACWYNPHTMSQLFSPVKKWVAIISLPFVVYFLGYFSILYGIGTLVSQAIGKQHSTFDVVSKRFVNTRKGCETRLEGPIFKDAFPAFFCVNAADFDALPAKVAIQLHGRESGLGFTVESIEYDKLRTSLMVQP